MSLETNGVKLITSPSGESSGVSVTNTNTGTGLDAYTGKSGDNWLNNLINQFGSIENGAANLIAASNGNPYTYASSGSGVSVTPPSGGNNKTWLYIGAALLALAALYFFMNRK